MANHRANIMVMEGLLRRLNNINHKDYRKLASDDRDVFDRLRDLINDSESPGNVLVELVSVLLMNDMPNAALWALQATTEKLFGYSRDDDGSYLFRPDIKGACATLIVSVERVTPTISEWNVEVMVDTIDQAAAIRGHDSSDAYSGSWRRFDVTSETLEWLVTDLEGALGSEELAEVLGEAHEAQWQDWAAKELVCALGRHLERTDVDAYEDGSLDEGIDELIELAESRPSSVGALLVEDFGWSSSFEDVYMTPDLTKRPKWKVQTIQQALDLVREVEPYQQDEVQV